MISELKKHGDNLVRLWVKDDRHMIVFDCCKQNLPIVKDSAQFIDWEAADLSDLEKIYGEHAELNALSPNGRKIACERYTMISGILPFIGSDQQSDKIREAAESFRVSRQTIRNYLKKYLLYQDVSALAPKPPSPTNKLSADQKNFRWALNKFFYTKNQNSLSTAYTMMLKARYTDSNGNLVKGYPSISRFRYYYYKNRKLEKYYITREGLKKYQKDHRPLLGSGVQEFAPNIGTAMLDSTVCDIYLINDAGELIGRPILVAACDANTSLCLGYSLLWQGGIYSLQSLMENILEDKRNWCKRLGISISPQQWPVDQLPGVMVTDKGSEYKGETFEQIAELGVTLINLPSYRPELKGNIEKLFDLVQCSYKDILKGSGVIMPDFQQRGAHDYRKDAILTIHQFEQIVVKCILYYNNSRILENYPYTKEMIDAKVKPYAADLWNWKYNQGERNLIQVDQKDLALTLLPRTTGIFSRRGLKVKTFRYRNDDYKEAYLQGGKCLVAYNPDNISRVWLLEKGSYVEFRLIDEICVDQSFAEAEKFAANKKELIQSERQNQLQNKIELYAFIETIRDQARAENTVTVDLKKITKTRQKETEKRHRDMGEIIHDESTAE